MPKGRRSENDPSRQVHRQRFQGNITGDIRDTPQAQEAYSYLAKNHPFFHRPHPQGPLEAVSEDEYTRRHNEFKRRGWS